jgi:hypothetical protein
MTASQQQGGNNLVAIAAVLSPVEFATKMAVRVRDSSRAASALCMHRLATEVTASPSVALPVVWAGTPFTIIGTAATVIKLVAVVDMPRMFGAGVAAHRVEVPASGLYKACLGPDSPKAAVWSARADSAGYEEVLWKGYRSPLAC